VAVAARPPRLPEPEPCPRLTVGRERKGAPRGRSGRRCGLVAGARRRARAGAGIVSASSAVFTVRCRRNAATRAVWRTELAVHADGAYVTRSDRRVLGPRFRVLGLLVVYSQDTRGREVLVRGHRFASRWYRKGTCVVAVVGIWGGPEFRTEVPCAGWELSTVSACTSTPGALAARARQYGMTCSTMESRLSRKRRP
jgi:hypothetical protein